MVVALYLLFFLSGAAALLYEVVWVRSLGLVFGGSHLAVTTVLSVFMGGLALGGRIVGRRIERQAHVLRFYGRLELGIAASSALFLAMLHGYSTLYAPLARLAEQSTAYLTCLRVAFAVAGMLVPTTLMGGTLPVLARIVRASPGGLRGKDLGHASPRSPRRASRDAADGATLGQHLSLLYGVNTLGAAVGASLSGFVLLEALGALGTNLVAIGVNVLIGLVALALPEPSAAAPRPEDHAEGVKVGAAASELTARLVLLGTAVGGFCALGYEVLWTRALSFVLGTSVYSFAIILVAFLLGMALGSAALGALVRRLRTPLGGARAAVGLGLVEVAIGVSAVAVAVLMRDLPSYAMRLQQLLVGGAATEFGARQAASLGVAFSYVLVPALLMGAAFPLAGAIRAARTTAVAEAVGEVLAYNTVGSILGAAVSGFFLVQAFGLERSIQMLAVANVAVGLAIVASTSAVRALPAAVGAAALALLVALGVDTTWGRAWDQQYFAIFRNNVRSAFDTESKRRDAIENTDVLYYSEGATETISVIRPKGTPQSFVVNGRPEASTAPEDVQCQRALGHLPMLLAPAPKKVFVLGTGTGMTLGATSIHPGVERIVLGEIEPSVLGATRTFAEWNHRVLDDPRLQIVFNDGRNHLATTREKFDVITADPIHPWSGGAAYLYTREYFRSVAEHLAPRGVACQWLPLYELSAEDVQTVVRTFASELPHVMIWATHYDAELIGSNDPIVLDEVALAARLADPKIAQDLGAVDMGTLDDLLAYFVAGDEGARAFGRGGVVNTDDNLWLELSAPRSMGVAKLMGDNVEALSKVRESLLAYSAPRSEPAERAAQEARAKGYLAAAQVYDRAHALMMWGRTSDPELPRLLEALAGDFADYAPGRFLRRELERKQGARPRLESARRFELLSADGAQETLEVSAVKMRIGETRAVVVFVNNARREMYGQRYLDGPAAELDGQVSELTARVFAGLDGVYERALSDARRAGQRLPPAEATVARFKALVVEQAGPP